MTTTVPNTFVNGSNADATQVNADFAALATAIDGVAAEAGVQTPSVKMRGSNVVATSEARSSTAYGLMPTPDRVTGIVVPTNGVLAIGFQATWFESVALAARAAIFIGSNQLKAIIGSGAAPVVQETNTQSGGSAGTAVAMGTAPGGLRSQQTVGTAYPGDVTTGQVIGIGGASGADYGLCRVFVAAGTYDISVQFKCSSGSVSALNRKLWVSVEGF